MAARLEEGFETSSWTVKFNEGGGKLTASIADATYAHTDLTGVLGSGNFGDFASAVVTAMDAAGANTYACVWNSASATYTISRDTGANTFEIESNPALPAHLALGFSAATGAGTSHDSDKRPYYVIVGDIGHITFLNLGHEPDDAVSSSITEGGRQWSEAKESVPKFQQVRFEFEPMAAVFDDYVDSDVPWTWEAFFAHNRGAYPILLSDTDYGDIVYYVTGDSARSKPQASQEQYFAEWHIPLNLIKEGSL